MAMTCFAQAQAETGAELVVQNTFLEFRKVPTERMCRTRTAPASYDSMSGSSDHEDAGCHLSHTSDVDTAAEASSHASDSDDGVTAARSRAQAVCTDFPKVACKVQTAPKPGRQQVADRRTTVMMRNLPNNYTRDMFFEMLDAEGFAGQYDFVYLPIDFKKQAGLGYAFVNLVDPSIVRELWEAFDGYSGWVLPTTKVCQVCWSTPFQGLRANVQRWRNSSVMHASVPEDFKPCIFENGTRVAFPSATRPLRSPQE
mmetsp:Transcript_50537/g.130195  ORF Transcript_50537/g.130195 Transcript_50537/m.130195 type:complete len:256 (+) Transcript_50537:67-834(+)